MCVCCVSVRMFVCVCVLFLARFLYVLMAALKVAEHNNQNILLGFSGRLSDSVSPSPSTSKELPVRPDRSRLDITVWCLNNRTPERTRYRINLLTLMCAANRFL